MAVRQNQLDDQLDLFANQRPTYDSIDSIRQTGREALARTPSENGARTGGQEPVARDASGSGAENEGRNGRTAEQIHPAGFDAATSARPRLGNGAGGIHPSAAGNLTNGHTA